MSAANSLSVNDFANGGAFVITGVEESQNRFPIWCNNHTKLVIANGGVLNLNSSGSIGQLDIIVADGGTLNLVSGEHTLNAPSKLIVMPGGLVEDKSNGESTTVTTTITHSYIVVESKDQVEQDWDTQFWVVSNNTFQAGQSWTLSMNVKAEKAAQSAETK
mgnify:FL=1